MNIDTLIIIGNGFDIWQGIKTSYDDFEKYYISHRDEIMRELKIRPFVDLEDGTTYSDVDMLYGDPVDPDIPDHAFWNRFEDSLAMIDDQRINLYFGKDVDDLQRIKLLAENAQHILQEAFSSWISEKDISSGDSGYAFPENCAVINFNYTGTIQKRFGVDEEHEYHIHGEASDKESLIVGHSMHPEYALESLKHMGGRFEGLYHIENALYESDKHVDDNYQDMAMNLGMMGADLQNIQNVYVLGHSFGEADYGYFRHLAYAMRDVPEDPFEGIPNWCLEYLSSSNESDFVLLNIQYAIHHRERLGRETDIPELPALDELKQIDQFVNVGDNGLSEIEQRQLERAAVRVRFLLEQAVRDAEYELEFYKMLDDCTDGKPLITKRDERKLLKKLQRIGWKDGQEMIREAVESRKEGHKDMEKEPPLWHISYHSPEDKVRIEKVMRRLHYTNYQLYPTIEECVETFKKR